MYKVMCNDIVIDLLKKVIYVRKLKTQNKQVITDSSSANGILSSNNEKTYHLYGTENVYDDDVLTVRLIKIDKAEYEALQNNYGFAQKDKEILEKKISDLETLILKQNELLQKLLEK